MVSPDNVCNALTTDVFQGNTIQFYGSYYEPLFCASQIAKVLGIQNISMTLSNYNEKYKVMKKIQTNGGIQEVNMLTERGLYKLLFTSRKDFAVQFQDWVFSVIRNIRINGYHIHDEALKKVQVQESGIIALKKQLDTKGKHTSEHEGFVYIAGNAKESERSIFKVGETMNPKSRLSTMNTCEPDNAFVIYHAFPTKDRKLAERSIHNYLDSQN